MTNPISLSFSVWILEYDVPKKPSRARMKGIFSKVFWWDRWVQLYFYSSRPILSAYIEHCDPLNKRTKVEGNTNHLLRLGRSLGLGDVQSRVFDAQFFAHNGDVVLLVKLMEEWISCALLRDRFGRNGH